MTASRLPRRPGTLAFRAALVALSAAAIALALPGPDPLTPPPNAPRRPDPALHVLVGATVHATPTQTFPKADVIIRAGTIEKVVVSGEAPPPGATLWDCAGLHVYPGFIEPFLEVDATAPDRNKPGVHWNNRVTPQRRALDGPGVDQGTARALRNLGFTAAAISPRGGIFRGRAAVVPLGDPDPEASNPRPPVYADDVYSTLAFDVGGGFGGGGGGGGGGDNTRWDGYPGSLMGSIALIRQTLIDADARAQSPSASSEPDALAAMPTAPATPGTKPAGPASFLFTVDDELDALRAIKVADEFRRTITLLGSGFEFRRLDALAASSVARRPIILPLNFPRRPGVTTITEAEGVDLRDLMTWEQAPTNPRRLAEAGFPIALTTAKLRDRGQFKDNLRSAIRHGFSESAALAALTTTPASILGVADQVGTVEMNKRANILVADGPIFAKKTKLRDVWVDGKRHEITPAPVSLEGAYAVTIDPPPAAAGDLSLVVDKDGGVTVKKVPAAPPASPAPAAPADQRPDGDAPTPDAKPEPKPDPAADAAPAAPEAPQPPSEPPAPSRRPREQTSKARNVAIQPGRISFIFDHEPFGSPGVFALSGVVDPASPAASRVITGDGRRADGTPFRWSATRTGPAEEPKPRTIQGKYRVTSMGGQPKGPREPAPEITIEDRAVSVYSPGSPPDWRRATVAAFDVKIEGDAVSYTLDLTKFGGAGSAKVSATREPGTPPPPPGTPPDPAITPVPDRLKGTITMPDGSAVAFEATRLDDDDEEPPYDVPDKLPGYPFGAYALESLPPQGDVLIQNATIWTCAPGVDKPLENAAIRIKDGKILFVGDLSAVRLAIDPSTIVIDAAGKHITPGIIDAHSHTGISKGVNEGGQAVTAEVRIQDVTNPDAINWYRQLAGGVTAVLNLHGSANAIGGQSQTNKIRWGVQHPDQMHLEGAIPGIKFALGENPKWGNSSGERGWRYPQTRMGVEAIIRDRFTAAREYAAARDAKAPGFRRDLELDALAEILAGTRLVHCHSYRQDEILMLGRLSAQFGFKIGTFQHILEGYKVAEILREHSGGASGFADWWAYKVEVQDAIPQAFPIMFEQGVLVSFNSDSDELARRLNVEAGKGVKYSGGSVSPAEALRWVTYNPAKQLRVHDRTGSLEVGKDADLVIWSGPPTSSLSRCEATYVDGRELFSLARDADLRARDAKERQRLIQKILADGRRPGRAADAPAGDAPAGGPPPGARPRRARPPQNASDDADHPRGLIVRMVDDSAVARRNHYLDLVRRGINPADHRSGDCGCEELMFR